MAHAFRVCASVFPENRGMHTHQKTGRQTKSIALLSAVLFPLAVAFAFMPSTASADYVAFQNKAPSTTYSVSSDYQPNIIGSDSAPLWISFVATNTIVQFDRLDLNLCRYLGSNVGSLFLEVRSSTSTGPIIASSTLVVNSGNVFHSNTLCYGSGGIPLPQYYSTFVLDRQIQTVAGVTWWFRIWGSGTVGNFYVGGQNENFYSRNLTSYLGAFPDTANEHAFMGTKYALFAIGRGLGTAPTNQNNYGASSTAVVCTTFDIGCYISSSFAYMFIPTQSTFDKFADITLASSTPFNYLFEMGSYFSTLRNGVATSTIISVNFVGTPLILYNSSNMTSVIGETHMARVTFVKMLISYALWLMLLFAIWREVIKIIRHDS